MISLWEYWVLLTWEVDRGIYDDLRFFLLFSGNEGPPNGPLGSPMVLNGHTIVPYYGMISLWEYWALLIWEVDKGLLDDLRRFVCHFQALKGPLTSPTVLNGQTSVPWEVEIKYSTMEWFHYGNTKRYSLMRWTKAYMMIWGFFYCCFQAMEAPLMAP